ncbi:hypothetical protein ACWDBW_08380 [Streptomyces sp. NPDC001107]
MRSSAGRPSRSPAPAAPPSRTARRPAFAAASTAAALACAIALTVRPSSYTGPTTEPALHARVPDRQPTTPTQKQDPEPT